jgi:DNA-binding IscR family transcriptional regulator
MTTIKELQNMIYKTTGEKLSIEKLEKIMAELERDGLVESGEE